MIRQRLIRFAILTVLLVASSAQAEESLFIGIPGESTVSADGSTVALRTDAGIARWTQETGIVPIGVEGHPWDISSDGSVIVGGTEGAERRAFRWSQTDGVQFLGKGFAQGVSHDGTVVAFTSQEFIGKSQAMRWDVENGSLPLGHLPGPTIGSWARDISADGQAIVGVQHSAAGTANAARALRWTETTGLVELGTVPAGYRGTMAWQVSADGSVAIGNLQRQTSGFEAGRWSEATGWIGLGDFEGGSVHSLATDVSADGAIVVGYSIGERGGEPFIWDTIQGMRNLTDVLRDEYGLGESLAGWHLYSADGISDDLRTIVGLGERVGSEQFSGWIARLGTPISQPRAWNVDASGSWSLAANWAGGVPNAVGVQVQFGGIITQPRTVTLDTAITAGQIEFKNAISYTIAGTNALTFDATTGDARINVTDGSHTISAPLALADNTTFTVTSAASNLSITGPLNATGRNLTKAGAGMLTANNLRAQSLAINGGTVALAPNGGAAGTSVLSGLTIVGATDVWTAKLDLANNDAVINTSAAHKATDFGRLHNQLKQGFNNGDWKGHGITSSTASANANNDTGLSLVDNALLGLTTFSGQPVTADSILLKYTYYGDIDANGQVDADDLTVFANNFGRTTDATQIDGDIDFNGAANADDLTVFANNFLKGVGNPLVASTVHTVPEPGTWLLVALAAALTAIIPRRRRSSVTL
jgi:hypothetical protein